MKGSNLNRLLQCRVRPGERSFPEQRDHWKEPARGHPLQGILHSDQRLVP